MSPCGTRLDPMTRKASWHPGPRFSAMVTPFAVMRRLRYRGVFGLGTFSPSAMLPKMYPLPAHSMWRWPPLKPARTTAVPLDAFCQPPGYTRKAAAFHVFEGPVTEYTTEFCCPPVGCDGSM